MKILNSLPYSLVLGLTLLSQQTLAGLPDDTSKQLTTLNQTATDMDKAIAANAFSISKTLNNLFATSDPSFPNISLDQNTNLDFFSNVHNTVSAWTQDSIDQQLKTMPTKIATAYMNLSNNTEKLEDPMTDISKRMTLEMASYDTLYLPKQARCDKGNQCTYKASNATLKKNAANLNFNSLFAPTQYQTNNDVDQQNTAGNFISFALETYQPMIMSSNYGGQDGDSQNKSFFDSLDEKLTSLKNDKDAANSYLLTVLSSDSFQKYWLALRTLQAQNSLVLSNFNYLAAERTPQKGLGKAYGLPINDASALQVETSLIDNSVNNPEWYKQIKTATPATLQREQLLATALMVKLQYENKLLNERNLATLSLLTHAMLQTSKQALVAQEAQLTLPPDSDGNSIPAQQQPQQPKKQNKK